MAKETQAIPGTLICTKTDCGKPRAGLKPWCKEHLAEYQREYESSKETRATVRGFAQGVDMTLKMLCVEFARHGKRPFSGTEIAFVIEHSPRPVLAQPADQPLTAEVTES